MTTATKPQTLRTETKDYKGNPLPYEVTFCIPVMAEDFGRWEGLQCIALTKTREVCQVSPWGERPLLGLCYRHAQANIEAGGSATANFGIEIPATSERTPERNDFLASVVVTAIEGGIGYWCDIRNYDWEYADESKRKLVSASAEISTSGEPMNAWKPVNLDTVQLGIDRITERGSQVKISPSIKKAILLADVEDDASDLDAEDADVIVQVGLFGEIVYG